jgi:hypothetical protein
MIANIYSREESMKLTRNSLRQIILEQLSMVKRNHSGWQGWVSEDDEDDNEDTDLEENPDDRLEEASGSGLPPGSGRIWVAGRSIKPITKASRLDRNYLTCWRKLRGVPLGKR